jgi:hypothetical protein
MTFFEDASDIAEDTFNRMGDAAFDHFTGGSNEDYMEEDDYQADDDY